MGHDPARSWDAHPRSSKYFMNLIQVVLRLRYHLRMGHDVADWFPSISFCSHVDPLPSEKALTLPNLPDPSRSPTPPNHITPQPPNPPNPRPPGIPRSCADSLHGDDDWATAEAQLFEALAEHLPAQGPAGPWGPLEPDFAPRGFGATRWAATRGWDFGDVLGFPFWLVCNLIN